MPSDLRVHRHLFFILWIILSGIPLLAQEPELPNRPEMRLVLNNGETMVGTIVSESDNTLVFLTRSGIELTLNRSQIREIQPLSEGRLYRTDPNQSRLLFAPTGRSLPKREGYIADYELLFPFVAYGAGSGVSLAGGFSLIPGAGGQVVYAAPKVTLRERETHAIAVGILAATYVGSDSDGFDPVGLLYAVATVGPPKRSATAGLAVGWSEGGFSGSPAIMLGGHTQLSNSVALLSENYIITGSETTLIISSGVRFFGERLAVDLAFFTSPDIWRELDGWPLIPWVGFAYNFGTP